MKQSLWLLVFAALVIAGCGRIVEKKPLSNPFFMMLVEDVHGVGFMNAMFEVLEKTVYETFANFPQKEVATFFQCKSNRINCSFCYCTKKAIDDVKKLEPVLASLKKPPHMKLHFNGRLDFFGKDKNELVILVENKEEPHRLHDEVVCLLPADFIDTTFPYVPHITLLRIDEVAITAFATKHKKVPAELITQLKDALLRVRDEKEFKVTLQVSDIAFLDPKRELHKAS